MHLLIKWWHNKIQVNPEYAKLRKRGINSEMEEKLDRMFMNITATGAHAWAPSCDSMPIQTPGSKECVSGRGKKRLTQEADLQGKNEKKPKGPIVLGKKKVGGTVKLSQQIDRFINVVENNVGTSKSVKSAERNTIAEVMKILESVPKCEPGSTLWLFATRLFLNKEKREMFATMKDDGVKLQWLQYEFAEK
ncbi:hypothetical protein M0R45_015657 [Rubus argutus]|uniref:Uncharacterized protein n=1 Tax=Rubus argutus TaxID=59490 RepID=A0AAW1XRF4_RUBAR